MLYRYFSLKEERHFQWLHDLLVLGKCFFPSARGFNDPNEFRFQLRAPKDKEVIKSTWQRDNPNKTIEEFENWYSSTNFTSWHVYHEAWFYKAFRTKFGVVCFSRNADKPTMWAHYANNHSGICVGFEDLNVNSLPGLSMSGNVSYQKALPVVQYFGEDEKAIAYKIFFVKCEDWQYEREFRLVADANATLTMDPSLIRQVIFGMHMEETIKERVREIVSKREIPLTFHEAQLSHSGYEMEIKPL